jgi:hypothetical protein
VTSTSTFTIPITSDLVLWAPPDSPNQRESLAVLPPATATWLLSFQSRGIKEAIESGHIVCSQIQVISTGVQRLVDGRKHLANVAYYVTFSAHGSIGADVIRSATLSSERKLDKGHGRGRVILNGSIVGGNAGRIYAKDIPIQRPDGQIRYMVVDTENGIFQVPIDGYEVGSYADDTFPQVFTIARTYDNGRELVTEVIADESLYLTEVSAQRRADELNAVSGKTGYETYMRPVLP